MLNRLRNKRGYLCGAMDRAKDGGVIWRQEVGKYIESVGGVVLNPCEKAKILGYGMEDLEDRTKRREWKEADDWEAITACKVIRNVDLRMVDISDYLVVYLDMDARPFGTIEELSLANRQKKPILVWIEGGKRTAPDWLFWMIPYYYIFDTKVDLLKYLDDVNSGCLEDTAPYCDDDRWVFFNFD